MSRAIAVVLVACILAGCQKSWNTNQQIKRVQKAIDAQKDFHAKRGEELQKQYERAKREFPVLARYVALQEVSFGVLATGYEIHIRDVYVSKPGISLWSNLVRPLDDDCIFKCLDCVGERKPEECADLCNCGSGPDN